MKIELTQDAAGIRFQLKTDRGTDVIGLEYDAASGRVFVWNMADVSDRGPDITVHLAEVEAEELLHYQPASLSLPLCCAMYVPVTTNPALVTCPECLRGISLQA